jgi:hypothetical protein
MCISTEILCHYIQDSVPLMLVLNAMWELHIEASVHVQYPCEKKEESSFYFKMLQFQIEYIYI